MEELEKVVTDYLMDNHLIYTDKQEITRVNTTRDTDVQSTKDLITGVAKLLELHVIKALEAASENSVTFMPFSPHLHDTKSVNKKSILTAYPLIPYTKKIEGFL